MNGYANTVPTRNRVYFLLTCFCWVSSFSSTRFFKGVSSWAVWFLWDLRVVSSALASRRGQRLSTGGCYEPDLRVTLITSVLGPPTRTQSHSRPNCKGVWEPHSRLVLRNRQPSPNFFYNLIYFLPKTMLYLYNIFCLTFSDMKIPPLWKIILISQCHIHWLFFKNVVIASNIVILAICSDTLYKVKSSKYRKG